MRRVLRYCRRHWPAMLALAYLAWQASREDVRRHALTWICVGLGALGVAMNLVVILVNGGMPARVSAEEIPAEARQDYLPIDDSTRLAFLADRIPLGDLLISPGDILLLLAVGALLLHALAGR